MQNNTPPTLLQRGNLASLVLVNLGVGTHAIVWFMVVTAMPNVVDDLHAEAYLSWATSVYLVSTILGGAMMALLKARLGDSVRFQSPGGLRELEIVAIEYRPLE